MLEQLADRGPDSAGIAFYRRPAAAGSSKVCLHAEPELGGGELWLRLQEQLADAFDDSPRLEIRGSHAVFEVSAPASSLTSWLEANHPKLTLMSVGDAIEIYKRACPPVEFIEEFALDEVVATHAIGHTRMATESRVTTEHSHPFSTGLDLCLVHNGSLSNHNRLRARLRREGVAFATDNDSEVAAGYLMWRMRDGDSLEEALTGCLEDLDGFYTFAVGSADGFAVLRDPIACKPAVMAETDDWVAIASEYRAIAGLPNAADAEVWEPEPGHVYTWSRN